MKKVTLSNKVRKTLRGRSGGFTLIEVLVALALVAIIAITFAGGLATASRAVLTADIRTNAESLARTQMEYVKNQAYNDDLVDGEATYNKTDSNNIPDGYTICSVSRNATNGTPSNCGNNDPIIAVPWNTDNDAPVPIEDGDKDLQKITLVIKHEDRVVITLEGYKVDR